MDYNTDYTLREHDLWTSMKDKIEEQREKHRKLDILYLGGIDQSKILTHGDESQKDLLKRELEKALSVSRLKGDSILLELIYQNTDNEQIATHNFMYNPLVTPGKIEKIHSFSDMNQYRSFIRNTLNTVRNHNSRFQLMLPVISKVYGNEDNSPNPTILELDLYKKAA